MYTNLVQFDQDHVRSILHDMDLLEYIMVKNSTDTPSGTKGQASDVAPLPQDFESALAQLESLVEKMESGTLPLDDSLAVYEQGVELARICQRRLDHAEQQVKVLQGNLLRPLEDIPNEAGQ